MKLGTRVFVQGVSEGGLADQEEVWKTYRKFIFKKSNKFKLDFKKTYKSKRWIDLFLQINENDLILSINGQPTDSLTIPEVLKLISGVDTVSP